MIDPAPRHTTKSPDLAISFTIPGEFLRAIERNDLPVPARAQAGDEGVAVDAGDRRFACGIDRRDHYRIRIVEAGAELLEQRLQARVAMRLHDGDDLVRVDSRAAFNTAAISTG